MREENWKPVVGYKGYYSISDLGRVRRDAAGRGACIGRILRTHMNRGYPAVQLQRHTVKIHCLVLAAFVGPRPLGMEINHKNGIKTDNRLENLEYATPSANRQHAYDLGLMPRLPGALRPSAILTEGDVIQIKAAIARGERQRALARQYGVTQGTVSHIANGRSWRHVA